MEQGLGFVATVCSDGTPNLSPKGTTTVWDDDHLVFADLASPGTMANLRHNPAVEINVVDPVARTGYRFKGRAEVHVDGTVFARVVARYERERLLSPSRVHGVALVEVERAAALTSPAYETLTRNEIVSRSLARIRRMYDTAPPENDIRLSTASRAPEPGHDRSEPLAAPYYRDDLALVHHLGFGFHADACAPGILALLAPLRERDGLVVELGCGSGLLTRHLVDAGHRVIATDASPAMLRLARQHAAGAEDIRQLVLPDDPIPAADAIVSAGHVLSYLPDRAAVERTLVAAGHALLPGGVLAIDLCDLEWAQSRADVPNLGRVSEDWAIITRFSVPSPDRFVREITTFVRSEDGSWRRDDERHDNVMIETSSIPQLLRPHGVEVTIAAAFGGERLPRGLRVIIGRRGRA
jgi:SAM-dependent methyltransferase